MPIFWVGWMEQMDSETSPAVIGIHSIWLAALMKYKNMTCFRLSLRTLGQIFIPICSWFFFLFLILFLFFVSTASWEERKSLLWAGKKNELTSPTPTSQSQGIHGQVPSVAMLESKQGLYLTSLWVVSFLNVPALETYLTSLHNWAEESRGYVSVCTELTNTILQSCKSHRTKESWEREDTCPQTSRRGMPMAAVPTTLGHCALINSCCPRLLSLALGLRILVFSAFASLSQINSYRGFPIVKIRVCSHIPGVDD